MDSQQLIAYGFGFPDKRLEQPTLLLPEHSLPALVNSTLAKPTYSYIIAHLKQANIVLFFNILVALR